MTIILSISVLFLFFGKLLVHPNTCYFSIVGDGIQVYYNALYHVFFDKNILTEDSMHYPYQESVFFTGCNPMLTTVIKYLGLKYYTIGILNLSMLFSIPLAAIFIYLIFKEYNINYLFASFSSVSIAFLSPQINRMQGHYNLVYCFAIPATIWLILKFYKNPSINKSIIISIYCFVLASIHMYLFVFSAAIIGFVWIGLLFTMPIKKYLLLFAKNFFIQIFLPFMLIQLIIHFSINAGERTSYPSGFFEYYSNLNGIFNPFGRIYESLFGKIGITAEVNFEGASFIGISAVIFSVFLIIKILFNVLTFKFKKVFNFVNDAFLNSLLVCGFIFLLFSFCIPFKYGYEELASKLEFLRQFRALGRFTWIFFYIINILLIIYVGKIAGIVEKLKIKYVLMTFVLTSLAYDAYCNVVGLQDKLNNSFTPFSDFGNSKNENKWVNEINPSDYQAVMPLPYFHIGSENFSYQTTAKTLNNTCIVSFKTGLPMISVYNSRISLDETFKSIQMFTEPNGKVPSVIKDFKNNKDILLMVEDSLRNNIEKNILSYAKFVFKTENFELYKITLSDLKRYYLEHAKNVQSEFVNKKLYRKRELFVTDSILDFVSLNYKNINKENGHFESGIKKIKIKDYAVVVDTNLRTNSFNVNCTLSFWIKNLDKDLLPRTGIEIKAAKSNNEFYSLLYSNLLGNYKQIDNKWTLIEHSFKLQNSSDKLQVILWNFDIKHEDYYIIDNLLLRPDSLDVYMKTDSCIYKNNKIYYLDKFINK